MEAVELPVHVGVGDSSGISGVEEKRAVRRRLRNAKAKDSVPLCSGGRRGMNGAAGGEAQYLYTAPARARFWPRPSAPRAYAPLARGGKGRFAEGELGLNYLARQGEGVEVTRPSSEYLTIVKAFITSGKWKRECTGSLYPSVFDVEGKAIRA